MRITWTKIRETCTPKDLEKCVIRCAFKEFLKWRLVFQQWSGQPIDEAIGGKASLIPKGF